MANIPNVTLNNGQKMPLFGLGTWNSPPGQVTQAVKDAIDLGYRHIDGAHCYQNEHEVGAGITAKIKEGVIKREDIFVVSKLWNTKHRPNLVVPSCKGTLKDLGLDYVDLYLIHWPVGYLEGDDPFPKDKDGNFLPSEADYVDTWKEMEECVKLGLTKSIGVSNFNSDQIFRILGKCTIKPVVNQIECHPYLTQRMMQEFCKARDILITGYSPLGSPARPWVTANDPVLLEEPKLKEIAKKYNKSPAQVALRWMVQRDIIAIPKTVNKNRLIENMNIFDFTLSDDDMAAIFSLEKEGGAGRGCAELDAKGHKYYPFNTEF
ncbi:aldo-keto reductase family 1 member B1 [Folsomia candida]|uniref:aldo-keto reductase family 1 member B1 n=1 Tax=Folsomia candida TaxID=158441 RepID=UPI000B8F0DFA|nr:aldo-keto reductase family 1 member B1 [Folsomia candida]